MMTSDLNIPHKGIPTPIDRDKLKIASFRTKEGVWADFTAAANKRGLTATDVIKACMEQFTSGEYIPIVNTTVNTQSTITREEIQDLIDTAISTAIDTEAITSDVLTTVSMNVNTEMIATLSSRIDSGIMTAINTLSLPTEERVNSLVSTGISTALVPIQDQIASLLERIEQLKKQHSNDDESRRLLRVNEQDSIAEGGSKTIATPNTETPGEYTTTTTPDTTPQDTPTDPTLKSITEDVLKFLAAKKASKEMKNQDVADWLLTNGYGRYNSTTVSKKLKPYLP
jgi:antitoxin component of RelBE/YafQ-DinJ toxin-antitoxin module